MDKKKMAMTGGIVLIVVVALIASFFYIKSNHMNADEKNIAPEVKNMNDIVVLETSMGDIELEMDKEHAPATVANFLQYVKDGFYDGTVFHRVIKGFMIQGGGFTPDGVQKQTRAPIKLESGNGINNVIGTVAMARTSDPDSATSQFFINTADNAFLDKSPGNDGYAVFGRVISGMDVVQKIESVETGTRGQNQDWPVKDVIIKKAYVKTSQ